MLSLKEIFDRAGTNVSQKNFVNAEKILEAGHLIKCGRNVKSINTDVVSFTAFCLGREVFLKKEIFAIV